MDGIGKHLLVDLWGCTPLSADQYRQAVETAVDEAGATLISFQQKQFEPCGYTGVALLAESHLAIHTWPEKQFVAIDFFTCAESPDSGLERALAVLVEMLQPRQIARQILQRGLPAESQEVDAEPAREPADATEAPCQ